jgi:hypothetical protein
MKSTAPIVLWTHLCCVPAAVAVCWLLIGTAVDAQQPAASLPEQASPRPAGQPVAHPHKNLATCYQVDPVWPQKPANLAWGAVPSVVLDKNENVWVFTRSDSPVQVYDAAGKFIRSWGDGQFKIPHGMQFDSDGNVWVTDVGLHLVMQFTPDGKLLKTLGTRGVPGEDATHFNKPTDVAVSPSGDVFVADGYANYRIVHFDRNGRFVKEWGKFGFGPGEFALPHAIVRDSKGRLYVADRSNVRIQVFTENGDFLDEWRSLIVPWGLYIGKNDEIWVCGSSPMPWLENQEYLSCPPKDQVVMQFAPEGKLLSLWTIPMGETGKEKPGDVNWLHGIAIDSHGNLFLGDIKGKRLQKFTRQENAVVQ